MVFWDEFPLLLRTKGVETEMALEGANLGIRRRLYHAYVYLGVFNDLLNGIKANCISSYTAEGGLKVGDGDDGEWRESSRRIGSPRLLEKSQRIESDVSSVRKLHTGPNG